MIAFEESQGLAQTLVRTSKEETRNIPVLIFMHPQIRVLVVTDMKSVLSFSELGITSLLVFKEVGNSRSQQQQNLKFTFLLSFLFLSFSFLDLLCFFLFFVE